MYHNLFESRDLRAKLNQIEIQLIQLKYACKSTTKVKVQKNIFTIIKLNQCTARLIHN